MSNTELPNGNAPVTGAPPAAFLITVAVAVVPAVMVNGSHVLVEPVKLASPRVRRPGSCRSPPPAAPRCSSWGAPRRPGPRPRPRCPSPVQSMLGKNV